MGVAEQEEKMKNIDVIWWNGARGMWDQALLIAAIEGKLVENTVRYVEHYKWHEPSVIPESGGGILVVPGATEDVAAVKAFVDKMKWCVLVITSDEVNLFPLAEFKGRNRIIWRQHPVPQRGGFEADRVFPTGWRPDTLATIQALPPTDKDLMWAFLGQVNNPDRLLCSMELDEIPGGVKHTTGGFAKGIDYPQYIQTLRRAKLAPSPAGNHNTDCFRIFEALECGTLPVVAIRPDTHPKGFNYWAEMTGGRVPFPLVSHWNEFRDVVKTYQDEAAWEIDRDNAVKWWEGYKRKMAQSLEADALALEGAC